MKTILVFIFGCFIALNAGSINIPSEIKQVTVYRQGAKISHVAEANLTAGNNEVIIGNLTSTIDANSIQVTLKGQAILLSAATRINYMISKKSSIRIEELQDSLTLLNNKLNWINNEQEIYKGEEKLIIENQKIVNEKEKITALELSQMADFYRNRLTEIRKKSFNNELELKKLNDKKVLIEKQLNELNSGSNNPTGEIVLNITAEQPVKISISFSYLTYNAGWNPLYDIRSESTSQPIDLVYKANVYQQTGTNWDRTNLTISTGNPTVGNDRPILNPWYIDFIRPYYGKQKKAEMRAPSTANMLLMDEEAEMSKEAAAPVPYEVMESTNQMSTEYEIKVKQDIPSDGKEHIVPIANYKVPASYIYHSVPKLDQHTYLLASVGGFGQYNLLPGTANLFFEDTYVGQSSINPETTSDSLLISLGRDDRVKIERNVLKDLTSQQMIGLNKKETKGFEIIVKNNKNISVSIDILDQVPISSNNDINVTIDDLGGALYNPDYGKLSWKINLTPGESKKIRFVYSVKYPKDKQIGGLN